MISNIDKNLLIAALESALKYGQTSAGVSSLQDLWTRVHALRVDFDADPATVTDEEITAMIATLQAVEIPDPASLLRLFGHTGTTSPGSYVAVSTWGTLLNKPVTFPPDEHQHNWSDISYKPYRYDPKVHRHPWEQIDNVPETFEPGTHAHTFADVTNKPTTYPPDAHAHAFADVTNKPTTYPPDVHAHAFADVTNKPTTYPPDAHAHTFSEITLKPDVYPATWGGIESKPANMKVIAFVSWTGNGTTSQVVATPFPAQMMQIIAVNGVSGIVTTSGALRTTSATTANAVTFGALSLTLNVSELTASGIGYTAIIYGGI